MDPAPSSIASENKGLSLELDLKRAAWGSQFPCCQSLGQFPYCLSSASAQSPAGIQGLMKQQLEEDQGDSYSCLVGKERGRGRRGMGPRSPDNQQQSGART